MNFKEYEIDMYTNIAFKFPILYVNLHLKFFLKVREITKISREIQQRVQNV